MNFESYKQIHICPRDRDISLRTGKSYSIDFDLENAKGSIIRNILSVSSNLSSASGYMLGQALLPDAVSLEENIEFIKAVTKEEVVALAKTVEPELEYILGNS